MTNKLAGIILCLYGVTGFGVMAFSEPSHDILFNLVSYGLIFTVIPLLGAYGLWFHKSWAMGFTLVFFLLQSVKPFIFLQWLPFYPPISLGIPFGDFTKGTAYLVDFFAIAMAVYSLILCLRQLFNTKAINLGS